MHRDYEVEKRHLFNDAKSQPEAFLAFTAMYLWIWHRVEGTGMRRDDIVAATFLDGDFIVWKFQCGDNSLVVNFDKAFPEYEG